MVEQLQIHPPPPDLKTLYMLGQISPHQSVTFLLTGYIKRNYDWMPAITMPMLWKRTVY